MKIALISMPFARLDLPSLALTQLKFVLSKHFNNQNEINVLYLNHDFLEWTDFDTYKILTGNTIYIKDFIPHVPYSDSRLVKKSMKIRRSYEGAGEWLFRKFAFPETVNSTDDYLNVYFKKEQKWVDKLNQLQNLIPSFLEKIVERYKLLSYDLLCFTSMFQQQNPNLAIIKYIKKEKKGIRVAVGGSNLQYCCAVFADECSIVDYYMQGDGYSNIVQVVEEITCKKNTGDCHNSVSKIVIGKEHDINDVISLDYSDFFLSFNQHGLNHQLKPAVFIETSRGCWWGEKNLCKFCDYNKNNIVFRCMDNAKAIKYLQNIIDQCNGKCDYLWSVDSIFPNHYLDKVFPFLNIPETLRIFFEVRPTLTQKNIKKLADFKITMIQAGIEALDTSTLTKLGKRTRATGNVAFIRDCCDEGIAVLWNLLCGIPDESLERFDQLIMSIPSLAHLYPPTGLWGISFDKNSEYVKNPQRYNLKLSPSTGLLQYLFPFKQENLEKISYFFTDENSERTYTLEKIKLIEKINKMIIDWQNKWKRHPDQQPMLYLLRRDEGCTVEDSRGDTLTSTVLDHATVKLLVHLQKPDTLNGINRKFKDVEIDPVLTNAVNNQWIWTEENDYVSLVSTKRPKYPVAFQNLNGWVWE